MSRIDPRGPSSTRASVNKAEVRQGRYKIELVLVAEDEAGALQEDRGDLFFTASVENRESPLYRALSTLDSDEHERYHCCYLQRRRSHPGTHCTGYVRQAIHSRYGCLWKEYTP